MPVISVVIPVYNGELTIKSTIESVLTQTFNDFELIVINDGSTDSTLDILGRFQDSRIKVYSYPNAGLSASRNRGIDQASGDYISFLDADDLWTADKLEAQLNVLRKEPGVSVAYSWTDFIDRAGNLLGYGIYDTDIGYVFPKLLVFFFIGSGSNALICKNVFEEVGRFDESLVAAEDWDMFLRIAARYNFSVIPKPQILYRITEYSMSSNVIKQEEECMKVVERAYAREPGKSLLHLKKSTYANLYLYLAAHALRGVPDREKGLIAGRFLWRSIMNDLMILKRFSLVSTVIFKVLTVIFLPAQKARSFRNSMKLIKKYVSRN
jgi:glycosyltransferase involved in cell wall biosynthesis